jgi:N-acetylneuraminic acid mutarotase
MTMTKIKIGRVLLVVCLLLSGFACTDEEDDTTVGNWSKTTPFKGVPRSGAVSFTIGTKVFVGLGYDGDDYLSDFYVLDITTGYWETLDPFPGTLRERAVAFSVNGKGYIGLGYNRDLDDEELGDFWVFDPNAGEGLQWSDEGAKDFEGTARYNAIGFALGSNGYVGTGYDGDKYNSDFWRFNPEANEWEEIQGYPGEKIEEGLAFIVNDKAYVCTGRNNGSYNKDFWEFSVSGDNVSWTSRTPDDEEDYYDEFTAAVARHDAVAFTMGTRAFIVGGVVSSATSKAVYQFDATTMVWESKTEFEGSARSLAIGYVLDGRAFVGTGQNGSSRYDDIWEFKPDEDYDEDY